MASTVITRPPLIELPVFGTEDRFPVRRVYCIGRNYAAHAVEMGHDPNREDPFFFQKNPDNLDASGEFPYPPDSTDVHHEAELAVMLKSGGTHITLDEALNHVYGYALSLDMTRRDLQSIQKRLGRPWEIGKAFERSAPVSLIYPASQFGHPVQGRLTLKVNGEIRQEGDLNQMIWKVPEIIAYLSEYFELAAGDVILSGTPSGVGPVQRGDQLVVSLEGMDDFQVRVI